jgi:RNA polymerase-binding transcription factor DksA
LLSKEFIENQKKKLEANLGDVKKELEFVGVQKEDGHWEPVFTDLGGVAATDNIGDNWSETAVEQEIFEERLGMMQNLLRTKVEIEKALKRIEDGAYGKCENCNEEISEERLEAISETSTCPECEQ